MFCGVIGGLLFLFMVLWLKLVKVFLKARYRLVVLLFVLTFWIWLDIVKCLPLLVEMLIYMMLVVDFVVRLDACVLSSLLLCLGLCVCMNTECGGWC